MGEYPTSALSRKILVPKQTNKKKKNSLLDVIETNKSVTARENNLW